MRADGRLWSEAVQKAKNGPRILIATSAGGFRPGAIVESMLAAALTLRGANVDILLCDEVLPACIQSLVPQSDSHKESSELAAHRAQEKRCADCFAPGHAMYESLGLPIHRYSQFISTDERTAARALASAHPRDKN